MKFKKIEKFECEDGTQFNNSKEAETYCEEKGLEFDYHNSILDGYLDFQELINDWDKEDIQESINILGRIKDSQ